MNSTTERATFNRATGLVIVEVRNSNPNGDPDLESDPRTLEADDRGVISPVSVKRKLRDLVLRGGEVMAEARLRFKLSDDSDRNEYGILEDRKRDIKEIADLSEEEFKRRYWDARLFGNTMLEAMQQAKLKTKGHDHFISTGVVQVGVGLSAAPVHIDRMTLTNVSSVQLAEEGEHQKSRGMAPLADRRVRHGVYAIPFFVNATLASKTGATVQDLELFKFLIPKAYPLTASGSRSFVFPIHAWYAEHTSAWGSCPDPLIVEALLPRRKEPRDQASTSLGDYERIPTAEDVPESLRKRLRSVVDLCELYS